VLESREIVEHANSAASSGDWLRRRGHIGLYVLAAVLGYVLGVRGLLGSKQAAISPGSTALSRIGFALSETKLEAKPDAWRGLRADVLAVRSTLTPEERPVFDLVVALRGLNSGGAADWTESERLCRALTWPRCDRQALEEMQRRSRP